VDTDNLTVQDIQARIREMDESRADLERVLEQRVQQAKYDCAQQVKDLIHEQGFSVADIVALLGGRRRKAPVAEAKSTSRNYTRYVDPDNPSNVYVRGVIPGWMKQKMKDQGYDPSSKSDREAFKANCLHAQDD
jgi:DNA-binding protein H-NS